MDRRSFIRNAALFAAAPAVVPARPSAAGNDPVWEMPAGVQPGAAVVMGEGPDTVTCSFGGAWASPQNVVLLADNRLFAKLTVSAYPLGPPIPKGMAYSVDGQKFTIHCHKPNGIRTFKVVAGDGSSIYNIWKYTLAFNYVPAVFTGPVQGVSGTGTSAINNFMAYNNELNWSMTAETAAPVAAAVASAPTVISGATINGAATPAGTLQQLVSRLQPRDKLKLPPAPETAPFFGSAGVGVPCTIAGAGMNAATGTTISAKGIPLANGKGVFCPLVSGVVFEDMGITGAQIPDLNGAAIRENGPGIHWAANRVKSFGNQDGILTYGSSNITLDGCVFDADGSTEGLAHNIYVNGQGGNPMTANTFKMSNSTSTHPIGGHACKSRANYTYLDNVKLASNENASALDIPNGGDAKVHNTDILVPNLGGDNFAAITYGVEGMSNAWSGKTLEYSGTIDNQASRDIYIIGVAGATLDLSKGTASYKGRKPVLQGWTNVIGGFTPARPG